MTKRPITSRNVNFRDYQVDFEIIKKWLIDNDKETDSKLVLFKQIKEILISCVYNKEKKPHQLISELPENIVLSAIGYEIGYNNDKEKSL